MPDDDRPERALKSAARALSERMRVLRRRGVPATRVPRGMPPSAVASRLSALERRVEQALAHGSVGAGEVGTELVRALMDETLAAWAGAWRWVQSDRAGGIATAVADTALYALFHLWWRVETVGLERLPARGGAIVVVNRAPTLASWEPLVVAMALGAVRADGSVRALVDERVLRIPGLGGLLASAGAARAGADTMRRLLARESWVVLGAETDAVLVKTFGDRYRLARFGRGFARVAIATGMPVVPVAVIGTEEVYPVMGHLAAAARWLGLPTLPVTPLFPLLGLGGLVPLPTKWRLHVGEPIPVADRYTPADAERPECASRLAEQARERLQGLVLEGLRRRRSVFLG